MNKALDIYVKYGDIVSTFTINTSNLQISLPEIVHRSILPSSSLPIKIMMGKEYTIPDEYPSEATVESTRELIRQQVMKMTDSRIIIQQVDEAILTAEQWFSE